MSKKPDCKGCPVRPFHDLPVTTWRKIKTLSTVWNVSVADVIENAIGRLWDSVDLRKAIQHDMLDD